MPEKFNPFDPDNFSVGFGWDGKLVTITDSRFQVDKFEFGDGTPVIDEKTGEQIFSHVWAVSGVSEDSEAERTVKYSIGKALVPTNDGNSFERADGKPGGTFNARAKAAEFVKHLKEAGFDLADLVDDDGLPSAKGLNGAMFVFKAHAVIDPKTHEQKVKNGYEQWDDFPQRFEGFSKSAGRKEKVPDEVSSRAYDLVTQLLTEAEGNTLTRVQVIQGLNKALAGDKDKNAIVQLAVSDDFNSAAPWKVKGTTISLN